MVGQNGFSHKPLPAKLAWIDNETNSAKFRWIDDADEMQAHGLEFVPWMDQKNVTIICLVGTESAVLQAHTTERAIDFGPVFVKSFDKVNGFDPNDRFELERISI